jgi:acetylornithine/succinyldiaminopimelate/putrescine aminotransferase
MRFLPPLVIEKEDLAKVVEAVRSVLAKPAADGARQTTDD